ncbi:hypothetical protein ACIP4Q_36505 [Streptomyces massasporeus]
MGALLALSSAVVHGIIDRTGGRCPAAHTTPPSSSRALPRPGQAGPGSGLWPVAAGRVAVVLVLLPDAARHARRLRPPPVRCVQAVLVGAGAALGLVLYLLAAQRQLLAVIATVFLTPGRPAGRAPGGHRRCHPQVAE